MKFKLVEEIKEAYLDSEEKFYDYRTGSVSGKNIFDTTKSGTSYYDDFLTDSGRQYMKKEKNLDGKIVQMSPNKYFKECGNIFGTTAEKQKNQTVADKQTIAHLTEVIQKYKRQFPITMLNYAANSQEGRHRMAVAGNLFGYDTEFPVLVVTYADEDAHIASEKKKNDREVERKLLQAISNIKKYEYHSFKEVIDEIPYDIERAFSDEVKYDIDEADDYVDISIGDVSYRIKENQLNIVPGDNDNKEITDDDIEYDDEMTSMSLDDFMKKYLS